MSKAKKICISILIFIQIFFSLYITSFADDEKTENLTYEDINNISRKNSDNKFKVSSCNR